jgi:hypothetical protein
LVNPIGLCVAYPTLGVSSRQDFFSAHVSAQTADFPAGDELARWRGVINPETKPGIVCRAVRIVYQDAITFGSTHRSGTPAVLRGQTFF